MLQGRSEETKIRFVERVGDEGVAGGRGGRERS